jgi:hypothetical protein
MDLLRTIREKIQGTGTFLLTQKRASPHFIRASPHFLASFHFLSWSPFLDRLGNDPYIFSSQSPFFLRQSLIFLKSMATYFIKKRIYIVKGQHNEVTYTHRRDHPAGDLAAG